jgi:predicted  nucleic acid-binding Zn-ribbon protein
MLQFSDIISFLEEFEEEISNLEDELRYSNNQISRLQKLLDENGIDY